jgi:hypothetical protein
MKVLSEKRLGDNYAKLMMIPLTIIVPQKLLHGAKQLRTSLKFIGSIKTLSW